MRKKIDAVRYLMEDDQQLTGEMIANTIDISVGSAYNILFEELYLNFFLVGHQNLCAQISNRQEWNFNDNFLKKCIKFLKIFSREL